jgi:hypothetical protein
MAATGDYSLAGGLRRIEATTNALWADPPWREDPVRPKPDYLRGLVGTCENAMPFHLRNGLHSNE